MNLKRLSILILFLLLTACGPAVDSPATEIPPTETAVSPTDTPELTPTIEMIEEDEEEATAVPTPTTLPQTASIPDDEIPEILQTLLIGEDAEALKPWNVFRIQMISGLFLFSWNYYGRDRLASFAICYTPTLSTPWKC